MSLSDKPKLLVVDDDSMVRSALTRLLKNDFEVTCYDSEQEAEAGIQSQQFDLALIDLYLGPAPSFRLLEYLQRRTPATTRILMSGALDLQDQVRSLEAGLVHQTLQKPWEPETLVVQMKQALVHNRLLQEKLRLEQLSTTDALTGLYNFRFLTQHLPQEIERSRRQDRPLSFIMIDVDHFKLWNDQSGHLAGDQVLQKVSAMLKEGLRSFDWICRYGGDEFCIVLQETSLATAAEIAERLRHRVLQQVQGLTISLGVASFPETSHDAESLIKAADQALYTAKKAGRNRSGIAGIQRSR